MLAISASVSRYGNEYPLFRASQFHRSHEGTVVMQREVVNVISFVTKQVDGVRPASK